MPHIAEHDSAAGPVEPRPCMDGHRPDDEPEPGDRCKDCGRFLTWVGPTHLDWQLTDL